MVDELKTILEMDIEEIISSRYSLSLLKIYSKIYLNGAQPRTCARSQRTYYNQLKKNGMEKAIILQNTVCKYKKTGLAYVQKLAKHIDLSKITDEDAVFCLLNGILKKEDFEILPVEFQEKKEIETTKQENKKVKYSKK